MLNDFGSLADWILLAVMACALVLIVITIALCRMSSEWSRYEEQQEADARRFNEDHARAYDRRRQA